MASEVKRYMIMQASQPQELPSGHYYVRAEDYDSLAERHRKLVEALENLVRSTDEHHRRASNVLCDMRTAEECRRSLSHDIRKFNAGPRPRALRTLEADKESDHE